MRVSVADDDVEGHRFQQGGAKRIRIARSGRGCAGDPLEPGPVPLGLGGAFVLRLRVEPECLAEIFLVQALTGRAAVIAGDDDRFAPLELRAIAIQPPRCSPAGRSATPSPRSG